MDVAKFLNKPKVLDDPQLFSTNAASPSQIIVAHVGVQPVELSVGAIKLDYVLEAEFDCVFTDPIPFN